MRVETDLDLATMVEQGDILELGFRASLERLHDEVAFLEDEALFLATRESPMPQAPPRMIHFLPDREETPAQVHDRLVALRQAFPDVWIHGGDPGWSERHGVLVGVDSRALFTARPEPGDRPEVATVVYGQETPVQSLLAELRQLSVRKRLVGLVLLPEGVGDQVLSPATTWGSRDMALLSVARLLMPRCHVRASWGALGWKLAQASIAFGADELACWGLEERLAYGTRCRPASQVEHEEAEAGVTESGRIPREMTRCDWAC